MWQKKTMKRKKEKKERTNSRDNNFAELPNPETELLTESKANAKHSGCWFIAANTISPRY